MVIEKDLNKLWIQKDSQIYIDEQFLVKHANTSKLVSLPSYNVMWYMEADNIDTVAGMKKLLEWTKKTGKDRNNTK